MINEVSRDGFEFEGWLDGEVGEFEEDVEVLDGHVEVGRGEQWFCGDNDVRDSRLSSPSLPPPSAS